MLQHAVQKGHTLSISLELPAGWKCKVSANDLACSYRREEPKFNGQRITLELMVDMLAEEAGTLSKFKIKRIWNRHWGLRSVSVTLTLKIK